MQYTRKNKGVCSTSTTVTIEGGIIQDIDVVGGCNGNLKGICALLKGQPADDAISRLQGLSCKDRSSSCPDQIALCLEEALSAQAV